MMLHPATLILVWCLLVGVLQMMPSSMLLGVTLVVLSVAMWVSGGKLAHLLRRTRWIALSLLLIYAWGTPGEPVYLPLEQYGPTWEGLVDGFCQLARLLSSLAGLAMLLDRLHRMRLIAGLHALLAPLGWIPIKEIGGLRERIAVRLALTLQYAEFAMLRGKGGWRETLDDLLASHEDRPRELQMPSCRFGLGDAAMLTACSALLALSMLARMSL